jgi:hypothetical protein
MTRFVSVKFVVRTPVVSKQSVWITGDCLQLGAWSYSGRIPLSCTCDGSEYAVGEYGIWSCLVSCEAETTIKYRYLLCEEVAGRSARGSILTAWEAGIPRVLQLSDSLLII